MQRALESGTLRIDSWSSHYMDAGLWMVLDHWDREVDRQTDQQQARERKEDVFIHMNDAG